MIRNLDLLLSVNSAFLLGVPYSSLVPCVIFTYSLIEEKNIYVFR